MSERRSQTDDLILYLDRIGEEAIRESFAEQAAFWSAFNRKWTDKMERDYPGYKAELNRRRVAAGLEPIRD